VSISAIDPIFISFTSGTTGMPKNLSANFGTLASLHSIMKYSIDFQKGDKMLGMADIGWIGGHILSLYGPLLRGGHSFLYGGKWGVSDEVTEIYNYAEKFRPKLLFTAPTFIRFVRKADPDSSFAKSKDLSSIKAVGTGGEKCDIDTFHYLNNIFPFVLDAYGQTEGGGILSINYLDQVSNFSGRPGTAGKPFFGHNIVILDENGVE
jgi:propionyl-CoA synthetase